MNRRGLSIDNINSKYRGASFVGSPIISQDRFPTAASPISMVGSPVARSFSPVSYVQPINSLAAPTSIITQPLLRRSVVRTPAPITIIQQAVTIFINLANFCGYSGANNNNCSGARGLSSYQQKGWDDTWNYSTNPSSARGRNSSKSWS